MSDLVLQSAVDLLAMISARKLSPLELAEEHILQIKRLNPQLNAIIDFDEQRVRAQARTLDQSPAQPGPLHGLPMTVKASIAVAGHRCETGSLLSASTPASEITTAITMARRGRSMNVAANIASTPAGRSRRGRRGDD